MLWKHWKGKERMLITYEIESFVFEETPMLWKQWKEKEIILITPRKRSFVFEKDTICFTIKGREKSVRLEDFQ